MGNIKSTYSLEEAVAYLKRENGPHDLSVNDIVTLAAEGRLTVCFPYKGLLGLFMNGQAVGQPTEPEMAQTFFAQALRTVYFNGILRSLSRPMPHEQIVELDGAVRKVHTLHPVRVVPVCAFASDPPIELEESEGHHWRRVHRTKSSWSGTQLFSGIPEYEWMIDSEGLQSLALVCCQRKPSQPGPDTSHSPTDKKRKEAGRTVFSTKVRRDTLTPVIEQARKQCSNPLDVAEVWAVLSDMAEKKVPPLFGATEGGLQWRKNGDVAIFARKALAERIRRSQQ